MNSLHHVKEHPKISNISQFESHTRANQGKPGFSTIAHKSLSTVYMKNRKPGLGARVTLGVGSLGCKIGSPWGVGQYFLM